MGSDAPRVDEPAASPPAGRQGAQARAFEALRDVLVPEPREELDELVRAAFLAGWYAGAAWRAAPRGAAARPERPLMDPKTYCAEAIAELRAWAERRGARFEGHDRPQLIAVLAYFALRGPAPAAFGAELRRLAQESGRVGRTSLAAAAAAILRDWENRIGWGSWGTTRSG